MKLTINNPNGIVESAFTQHTSLSFSLFINTTIRNVWPDLISSDKGSKTWYYSNEDYDLEDTVTLHAENEEDVETLRRFEFKLLCKDQLWILLPKSEVVIPV